jgi:hypothetical protein
LKKEGVRQLKRGGKKLAVAGANAVVPGLGTGVVVGAKVLKIVVPIMVVVTSVFLMLAAIVVVSGEFSSGTIQYALNYGAQFEIPDQYLSAYQSAGAEYNVPWTVLAGVGQLATDQGVSAPSDKHDYGKLVVRSYPDSTSTTVLTSKELSGSTCSGSNCVVSPAIGVKAGEPEGPLLLDSSWLASLNTSLNPQSINDAATLLASIMSTLRDQLVQNDPGGAYANYQSDPTEADDLWAAVVSAAPVTLPSVGPDSLLSAENSVTAAAPTSTTTTTLPSIDSTPNTGGATALPGAPGSWIDADDALCPSVAAGPNGPAPGTDMTSYSISKLCKDSVAGAASPQAALAIIAALSNMGLIYTENIYPSVGPVRTDPGYSDCSSYVSRDYAEAGVGVNPGGTTLTIAGDPSVFVPEQSWQAKPGDLIMFSNEKHVGMVLADGVVAQNGDPGPTALVDSGSKDIPAINTSHVDMLYTNSPSYWYGALYFRINPAGTGASGVSLPTSSWLFSTATLVDYTVVDYAVYYGGDYSGDARGGEWVGVGTPADTYGNSAGSAQVTAMIKKYWPKSQVSNAITVATCESSLNPSDIGVDSDGTEDLGVFQLNTGGTLQELLGDYGYNYGADDQAFNAEWNVKAGATLWKADGWSHWTCAVDRQIVVQTSSGTWIPGPGDTSSVAS